MNCLLKLLFMFLPLSLAAATPVFYMPMDDSADVIGPKQEKFPAGIVYGRIGYKQGISGKAIEVKRHAYDQVTAVNFLKLPEIDCNSGTVSFWFKPEWRENDSRSHFIFSAAWVNYAIIWSKIKKGLMI